MPLPIASDQPLPWLPLRRLAASGPGRRRTAVSPAAAASQPLVQARVERLQRIEPGMAVVAKARLEQALLEPIAAIGEVVAQGRDGLPR